jgi:acyl transferase domain-containing protein/acyl carrier protein/NAD(P)-dependent dehydrogenase (short-subunit alcohol dehydrogenase family)
VKTDRPNSGTPLAIIGIGCLFPKADDATAYWANIREGIDAITDIPPTHWRTADYFDGDPKSPDMTYGRRGGFLSPVPFNPMEFNIPPNTLEAIDSSQLLGLVAAGQALRDAGYGPERDYDRSRVSVVLGVTGTLELVIPLGARLGHPVWRNALKEAGVDEGVAEDVVQRISDSYVSWQENSFPGLLGNVVAGRISKQYDLGGTNCVVDAACASSFSALHLAGLELAAGKSDMVVTGGIDTFNDIFMYMCFSKTPALSPTGNAKPFDASGDGTILGEGLGIVVIKRLADAERDGDRIYAVIHGVGSSSDGKGEAIYTPSSSGQKKAILDACERAGVTPESIGMVEAHGTGTKVGDAVEVSALREVYGNAERPWCALGSVKSQIGHTKAAAGAAGMIKAALALHHKTIPPTIKVENPLDEITAGGSPFYLATKKRPWLPRADAPRRAAVSAFGFGGSNFHAILEEYRPAKERTDWDGDVQILPFSAGSAAELETALAGLPADGAWNELRGRAASLRASFDAAARCRLVLIVERDRTNFGSLIANAAAMLCRNPESAWTTPDGAFFACGAAEGGIGLLFPGQGSQYTGMLRDLACSFPQMLDVLAGADDGFAADGSRLSDLVYPPFVAGTKERQEEELRATENAQPAIGAISLGALRVLEGFGVAPEAVAGHSYGELTALCAAGRIDQPALHNLSRLRGRLMASGEGDKGSMLAVSAPLAAVEEALAEEKLELVIANRNAPTQAVLSGSTAEIERAASVFAQRKLTCKRLPVAAAFHSPLVADAAAPFLAALAETEVGAGTLPVYANTTAGLYPADATAARELLAGQLARPVEFVAEIEAIYAAGIRTFVEVGPGARLTGLVRSILGERSHTAVALDASAGKRSGIADLARTLAQLAVLGHGVQLEAWDEGFVPRETGKKPAMTVPISGANYVKPKQKRPPVVHAPAPAAAPQPPVVPENRAVPQPMVSAPPAATRETMTESLRATRESMAILQKMQQETAELHRRFLEGQEAASRTFQSLLDHQQRILQGGAPAFAPPAAPVAAPQVAAPQVPVPQVPVPQYAAAAPAVASVVPAAAAIAAPAPVPAAAVPAPAPLGGDAVARTLLAVVSEKTGYPVEMLELDMGLDSDLGIDSIKRVEILSALQERLPGSPVIGPEHLGTLRTLGEIARHLGAGSPEPVAAAAPATFAPASAPAENVAQTLLAVVSEKTGYPSEMLELDMGLDSDLGIDSIKRVEILSALQERLPGSPVIGPEHLGTLRTLGEIARHLCAGSPAPAAAPAAGPVADVAQTLLAVVSEKTGYPVEMLELDMGLDSDLGIDSIKRVEILSALQERLPGSPVIGPEHLGTLRTLGEIARHLGAGSPPAVAAATPPPAPAAAHAADVAQTLLAVVSEKTGYPVEMLELDMGLDSDLGIDSIKRVEILSALQERLPGSPVIGPEHLGTLRTLGEIARHLKIGKTEAAAEPVPSSVSEPAPAALPVGRSAIVPVPLENPGGGTVAVNTEGAFWVAGDGSPFSGEICRLLRARGFSARLLPSGGYDDLSRSETISGLVVAAPESGTDDRFLEDAFILLKNAAPGLLRAATTGGAIFATVSRLDGSFGCGAGSEIADPLSGGLAGLSKTAGREWPEVTCKAIDAGTFPDDAARALAVVEELFRPGQTEVGLTPEGRTGLRLAELPAAPAASEAPVREGEVVVITGGGRGVTAAAAVALAQAYRPLVILVGRSAMPAAEPAWLASLTEEAPMKRAILEHAEGKIHPREIEERYRGVIAGREIVETLARVEAAGGRGLYRSADIRDAGAVGMLFDEIRREHGPIRGIVHGAGVLADRLITDKTREQFRLVYETKVAGLRSVLAAAGDALRFVALFSSTTGRFGRTGQVDYAVANEVLNKLAQAEGRRRPACRVVSINWGPWDGGMVTPALKKVFAGERIGLIGLEAGGDFLVREIAATGDPVEVVALAGAAGEPAAAAVAAPKAQTLTEALSLALTVDDYPFLRSHVLDGKAVLPMAVIVEWLAHGALHGNPGFRFHGFNDLRICKGIVFGEGTTCNLRIMAGRAEKRDSFFQVPVELCSAGNDGRGILHAKAEIVLSTRLPEGIRSISEIPADPYHPHNGTIYDRERLFHGPDLHGIEQVDGCSASGIAATVKGAPAPATWISQPLRSAWLTDPLAIDSAFQLMILWSFERFGAASLPCFAGRYRQFHESFPRDGVQVVVRVTAQRERGATADIEFLDRHSGKLVARLEDYECVIDPSLQRAFQRNRLTPAGNAERGAA